MVKRGRIIRFPGAATPAPAPGDRTLLEVRRCRDRAEALVVRSLLESHGIPCLLRSRIAHSVHPFTVGDQGEVVILVPAAEASRAQRLLRRRATGPTLA